jgi:uncharacterized protein YndB with AHSA1/START domain
MLKESKHDNMSPAKEFTISRTFNAPRELMFKVWTEPEHLVHWWGPKGFRVSVNKLDLRPGGIFHYGMKTPDGHQMWGRFVYKEIIPPEKLVFIVSFSDEEAGITTHPMSQSWPKEVLSTVLFTEEAGKTTLTMTGIPVNASHEEIKTFTDGFASMQQGWAGTMGQLEDYLANISA